MRSMWNGPRRTHDRARRGGPRPSRRASCHTRNALRQHWPLNQHIAAKSPRAFLLPERRTTFRLVAQRGGSETCIDRSSDSTCRPSRTLLAELVSSWCPSCRVRSRRGSACRRAPSRRASRISPVAATMFGLASRGPCSAVQQSGPTDHSSSFWLAVSQFLPISCLSVAAGVPADGAHELHPRQMRTRLRFGHNLSTDSTQNATTRTRTKAMRPGCRLDRGSRSSPPPWVAFP